MAPRNEAFSTYDPTSNAVFFASSLTSLSKIGADNRVSSVAGSAEAAGSADGVGPEARFSGIEVLAADCRGGVWVGDENRIPRLDTRTGTVTTLEGADAPSNLCWRGLAVGPAAGTLWAATSCAVCRVNTEGSGSVELVAGDLWIEGSADDSGLAARFETIRALLPVSGGRLLIADGFNLRCMDAGGAVTTLLWGCYGASGVAAMILLPSGALAPVAQPGILTLVSGGDFAPAAQHQQPHQPPTASTDRLLSLLAPPAAEEGAGSSDGRGMAGNTAAVSGAVTVRVGDRAFPVQRSVLAAGSEYIARLLAPGGGFEESGAAEVSLPDADPAAFAHLLSYMYGTSLGLSGANSALVDAPPELLRPTAALAGRLLMGGAVAALTERLAAAATPASVLSDLAWADAHGLADVAERLRAFAVGKRKARSRLAPGGGAPSPCGAVAMQPIRKLSTGNRISTAMTSEPEADEAARISAVYSLAADSQGSVWLADVRLRVGDQDRIRHLDTRTGEVATLAGAEAPGPWPSVRRALAVDPAAGMLWAATSTAVCRVRTEGSGGVELVAGNWEERGSVNGMGTVVHFAEITALLPVSGGRLLIADVADLRCMDAGGAVTTLMRGCFPRLEVDESEWVRQLSILPSGDLGAVTSYGDLLLFSGENFAPHEQLPSPITVVRPLPVPAALGGAGGGSDGGMMGAPEAVTVWEAQGAAEDAGAGPFAAATSRAGAPQPPAPAQEQAAQQQDQEAAAAGNGADPPLRRSRAGALQALATATAPLLPAAAGPTLRASRPKGGPRNAATAAPSFMKPDPDGPNLRDRYTQALARPFDAAELDSLKRKFIGTGIERLGAALQSHARAAKAAHYAPASLHYPWLWPHLKRLWEEAGGGSAGGPPSKRRREEVGAAEALQEAKARELLQVLRVLEVSQRLPGGDTSARDAALSMLLPLYGAELAAARLAAVELGAADVVDLAAEEAEVVDVEGAGGGEGGGGAGADRKMGLAGAGGVQAEERGRVRVKRDPE
ncbi:hypothetical protein HYH03_008527 [Edaphochlamys debaryana]|uniref:BTB domain-containing protein n=1 Tax=Edaphochlamys debaryana TaxID=47281 RepID=A0A835Y6K1_9CHLO|nr:hypothetical protein HYH03_008527 [Edaphochlamys debaryana]|eukprot:KAG2493400.1 hypothetical protein HYH03_008527 [Edaphochlamys debaryana]